MYIEIILWLELLFSAGWQQAKETGGNFQVCSQTLIRYCAVYVRIILLNIWKSSFILFQPCSFGDLERF